MKDRNMRVLKVLVTCEETHSKILSVLDDNNLDYVISITRVIPTPPQ